MYIDAHQHFWKFNPVRDSWIDDSMKILQKDFLPADLHPILNKNEIDGCIAVQADQSEEETVFLLDLTDKNNFINAVVGWVDLCDKNIEERLAHFSKYPKFKGVRHILQAESNDFLLEEDFLNGISKLEKMDLVYEILIRKEQLENTIKLVAKFPNQTFVLDHIAKPNIQDAEIEPWKSQIEQLAKHQNVHCKVSGLVTEADLKNHKFEDFIPYLDIVFNAFGIDRILFGSDWPVCLLASSYADTKLILEKYISTFTEEEKDKIMGGNAFNLYLN
jgi:L-fuconolactonase